MQQDNRRVTYSKFWVYFSEAIGTDFHKVWSSRISALSPQSAFGADLTTTALYRFSAFWLRSKCSICSYQLNIWYDPHVGSTILNWFLAHGEVLGACSTFAADRPGIAVPPGLVHSPRGEKNMNNYSLIEYKQ